VLLACEDEVTLVAVEIGELEVELPLWLVEDTNVDVIEVVLELEVTITQKTEVDQSPDWELDDEDVVDVPP
jgi:hypothetical protein